jgi:hypothetical protein
MRLGFFYCQNGVFSCTVRLHFNQEAHGVKTDKDVGGFCPWRSFRPDSLPFFVGCILDPSSNDLHFAADWPDFS